MSNILVESSHFSPSNDMRQVLARHQRKKEFKTYFPTLFLDPRFLAILILVKYLTHVYNIYSEGNVSQISNTDPRFISMSSFFHH